MFHAFCSLYQKMELLLALFPFCVLLFKSKFLFYPRSGTFCSLSFRKRGMDRRMERVSHALLASPMHLIWWSNLQLRPVPWPEINPQAFSYRNMLQPTESHSSVLRIISMKVICDTILSPEIAPKYSSLWSINHWSTSSPCQIQPLTNILQRRQKHSDFSHRGISYTF